MKIDAQPEKQAHGVAPPCRAACAVCGLPLFLESALDNFTKYTHFQHNFLCKNIKTFFTSNADNGGRKQIYLPDLTRRNTWSAYRLWAPSPLWWWPSD
jgi:hypothetical protein